MHLSSHTATDSRTSYVLVLRGFHEFFHGTARHRCIFLHLVLCRKLELIVCLFIALKADGANDTWYLSTQCNVTCGYGVEIWRRSCDGRSPKYRVRNCTMLGKDLKYLICKRQPCPSTFIYKIF